MKKLFSLFFVLHGFSLFAQDFPSIDNIPMDDIQNPVKIPNSPEATQFTKYGNIDVSLYTGTPNISIPIYTLQGKEVSVPISLSYDASGIKVEQISTRVGIGWNVNVGGTVTRMIRGEADIHAFTPITHQGSFDNYMNEFIDLVRTYNLSPGPDLRPWDAINKYFEHYDRMLAGKYVDTEPDLYNFNINGTSGKFYIDVQGNPVCINDPSIKIGVHSTSSTSWTWVFTMTDGTKYYLEKSEETTFENASLQRVIKYPSAWYLTKIESPNKIDIVTFTYIDTPWAKKQRFTENKSVKEVPHADYTEQTVCGGTATESFYNSSYKINHTELSYITLNNGEQRVHFVTGDNREDLEGTKKLERIYAVHKTGIIPTKVTFEQSYFSGSVLSGFDAESGKRLKLNKVIFQEGSGGNSLALSGEKHEYSFTYYEDQGFPSRHSMSQDRWGYYNGKPNTTLVPKYDYTVPPLSGADRSISLPHAQSGSLKQITYPTGGTSEFTYESNMLGNHQAKIDKVRAIASVVGEGNKNSTYNYKCHGVYPQGDFNVSHGYFKVTNTVDLSYKLKLNIAVDTSKPAPSPVNTTAIPNNQLVLIVPTNYYDCYLNPSAPGCNTINDSNDICALMASGTAVYSQYFNSTNQGIGNVINLNLTPGTYKVFLVNRSPAVTMTLTEYYQEYETKPTVVGGLRIKKIVDKADANSVAQTKLYHYDEIKPTDTLNLDYFEGNNSEGNGVLHTQTVFEKRVNQEKRAFCDFGQTCDMIELICEFLLRSSNNMAENYSSHIVAYNKVTETKWDGTRFNGYTTYEFYNESEDYTLQKGILNGKLKSKYIFNDQKVLQEQQNHTYEKLFKFQNGQDIGPLTYGVITRDLGMNRGRFRVITKDANDPTKASYKYDDHVYVCGDPGDNTNQANACKVWVLNNSACDGLNYCRQVEHPDHSHSYFIYQPVWTRLTKSIYTSKLNGQDIVKTVNYTYGNEKHFQMTKMVTTTSEGKTIDKRLYYPDDMPLPGGDLTIDEGKALSKLNKVNGYRIGTVVQTEVFHDSNILVTRKRTTFKEDGDRVIPKAILTAPSNTTLETRMEYLKHDDKTNPLEVRQANGTVVSYIWGHDKTLPIAKIENATYAEIAAALSITETQLLAYNETNMSNLNGLRANANLAKAMITTYTYKPLVGITSTTDARGLKTTYEYDHFGRLVTVRDADGKLLTSNKYNYKQ